MRNTLRKIASLVRPEAPIERRPWDFPEMMLMDWIRKRGNSLTIYIIGAHMAYEVDRLLATGTVEKIVLFEALPSTAEKLRDRMKRFDGRVEVIERAVCDFDGKTTFFETNLPGAGSILEASVIVRESYGASSAYEVEVETVRLDTFLSSHGSSPDILWIDVQGAELKVLRGASQALKSAKLIFIEVSTWVPLYDGGCVTDELTELLAEHGFRQIQLGTDLLNGSGNALYAKPESMGLGLIAGGGIS